MVVQFKRGFTLIEILIVVVIIGILGMIAYPSYTDYVIKTKRVDAQSKMIEISQKLMQYKATNGSFAGASLTDNKIYGSAIFPQTGDTSYTFTLDIPNANSWTLIAEPATSSTQDGNGWICLNNQGQKFWAKGATACVLSATSTWDGH